jgi:hypothetical protein
MRRLLVLALAAGLAPAAFADGLPDGRGVATPSGSQFQSEITPVGDADDYVFDGYRAATLTASVSVSRKSTLAPVLEVFRPDGTLVAEGDGLVLKARPRSVSARFTLDATGRWKVRVRGGDGGPTGDYAVALKTSKPGRSNESAARDENGQYRFRIPARGGARLSWSLEAASAATFNSLVDPRGIPVTVPPPGAPVRGLVLPDGLPMGEFVLTFDAPANAGSILLMTFTAVPPKAKPRKGRLSAIEPAIVSDSIAPASGGAGTLITLRMLAAEDPAAPRGGAVGLLLDDVPLEDVQLLGDHTTVTGRVPAGLALGRYDVVATSTSGQPAVRADAFEVVPPPTLLAFDPPFGSVLGGGEITLTGRDFRASMGLLFDGTQQPVTATYADAATLRFPLPTHGAGFVTVGVVDLGSQLRSELSTGQFEFVTTPVINRVSPALVPILGGETVTLDGLLFAPDDHVFLETTTPGSFEDVSATQTTFMSGTRHRFVTPLRPKGDYRVYVIDAAGRPNPPKSRTITYFDFANVTAASGFGTSLTDSGDAVTSALLDVDGDGDLDLALARSGGATAAATPQTRVFVNDGHGVFSDATAAVMPPAGADDWRADRIVAADIDGDGRTDLLLTTNSLTVPPADRSHTRLLMNERRGGTAPDAEDRVLRDRTIDLMAPVRTMKRYGAFGGDNATYVSDGWRGLDVWVGDLDANGSGPPDIVLTHDELKDDDNPNAEVFRSGVYCGNYCAAPQGGFAYAYTFYWGGSRAFTWDKNARSGLGRYKFDPNYFPRKSGPLVPSTAPGGIGFQACSPHYNSICKSTFTPFTGKRLAVGDLDADGKLDVAVVADHAIQRRFTVNGPLTTISSLQVARQGFNAQDGAKVTDVTAKLTALGTDLTGDAVAIGRTGYPDGNAFGTIAIARASSSPGLRLLRFFDNSGTLAVADVSAETLPAPVGADVLQAGEIRFLDVDGDGDQELVLLAPAAPGGTQAALRILRNGGSGAAAGVFDRAWNELVAAAVLPGDPFEGSALSIGDLTGDGLPEFTVSRALPGQQPADTRILSIQR